MITLSNLYAACRHAGPTVSDWAPHARALASVGQSPACQVESIEKSSTSRSSRSSRVDFSTSRLDRLQGLILSPTTFPAPVCDNLDTAEICSYPITCCNCNASILRLRCDHNKKSSASREREVKISCKSIIIGNFTKMPIQQ